MISDEELSLNDDINNANNNEFEYDKKNKHPNFEFINYTNSPVYYGLINDHNILISEYFGSKKVEHVNLIELRSGEIHADGLGNIIPTLDITEKTQLIIGNRQNPILVHVFEFEPGKRILLEYGRKGVAIQGGSIWYGFFATANGHSKVNAVWNLPISRLCCYDGPKREYEYDDFVDNSQALIPFHDDDECANYGWWVNLKIWLWGIFKCKI